VGPAVAFAAAGGDKQADVCAFLGADEKASPEQRDKLRSELVDTVRLHLFAGCTWSCLLAWLLCGACLSRACVLC
jgi:hypothetical protein